MALRVKRGFSFDHKGVPVTLRTGQLFDETHPYVKGHEQLFEQADEAASRSSAHDVETATAVPGSRRVVSRRRSSDSADGEEQGRA